MIRTIVLLTAICAVASATSSVSVTISSPSTTCLDLNAATKITLASAAPGRPITINIASSGAAATLSASSVEFSNTTTSATFTITPTATGTTTITFTTSDANTILPSPTVFATPVADTATGNSGLLFGISTLYSDTTQTISLCRLKTLATSAKTYTVTSSQAAVAVSPSSVTMTTDSLGATMTLTITSYTSTFNLVVASSDGTETATLSYTASAQGAVTFTRPTEIFIETSHVLSLNLSTATTDSMTATIAVSGAAAGSTTVSSTTLMFASGESAKTFSVATLTVPGNIEFLVTLTGNAANAYAVSDHKEILPVNPRATGMSKVLTPKPPAPIYAFSNATIEVDLGRLVPLGHCLTVQVVSSFAADATTRAFRRESVQYRSRFNRFNRARNSRKLLAMMTQTTPAMGTGTGTSGTGTSGTATGILSGTIPDLVICERERSKKFLLPAPRVPGNLTLSYCILGSAVFAFNAPKTLKVRVEKRSVLNITGMPTTDGLFTGEKSKPITAAVVGKLPMGSPVMLSFMLSGPAAAGARVEPKMPQMLDMNKPWPKFNIVAGGTAGALMVTPMLSGPGAVAIKPDMATTITVTETSTATLSGLPSGLAHSATTNFYVLLGAVPTRGDVTITATTSDSTLLTVDGPITIAKDSTSTPSFNLTAAASGTGQVDIKFTISGTGAPQYGPVNGGKPSAVFVISSNGVAVNIQRNMFTENTITGTVFLGSEATNGLTVTISESFTTTALGTIPTNTLTFAGTTRTNTFEVTSGTTPGLMTLAYALAGSAATTFSSGAADSVIAISARYNIGVAGFKGATLIDTEIPLTVTIPAKLPRGETLSVSVSCTEGSFDGAKEAMAVFGPGSTSATVNYKTSSAPGKDTINYVNNGTFIYALATRPSDTVIVLGDITATYPTTLLHDTVTNVSLTVNGPDALTGRTLTLTVRASGGASVSGGAPYSDTTEVTLTSGSGTLSITAPHKIGPFDLTFEIEGTAAAFYFNPKKVSIETIAQIEVTGQPASLVTGQQSDVIIVTLSQAVPTDSANPLILTPEITANTATGLIDVTTNPSALVFLPGQRQASFRIAAGAQIGNTQLALRVSEEGSGDFLYAAYQEPFAFAFSVRAPLTFTDLPKAIETGTTSTVKISLPATPTAEFTISMTVTGGATIAPTTALIFNTSLIENTFTLTAPSSAAVLTLSFSFAGVGQDGFVVPADIPIQAIASGSYGAIVRDTSLFGTQCSVVELGFFPALATGKTLYIGGTLSGETTGAGLKGVGQTDGFATIAVGDTTGSFQVCAGTATGTLTLTFNSTGTAAGSYTSASAIEIAVTAQGTISGLAPSGPLTTGTTTAVQTATLSTKVPSEGPLTLNIKTKGPRGIEVDGNPLVFAIGETEKTYTVRTPYIEGSFTMEYELFGPSKIAYVAPSTSSAIQVNFPTPAFEVAEISENSGVKSALNSYTVRLQPTQPINKGATISITGLYFSCDSSCSTTKILKVPQVQPAGRFAGAAKFKLDTGSDTSVSSGTFRIKATADIPAGEVSTFTFRLNNPAATQTAALTLAIGAKSGGVTFVAAAFTKQTAEPTTSASVGMAADASVYAVTMTVTETSKVKTAYNVLTFAIQPTKDGANTDIPAGSSIVISGFSNIQTAANAALAVTGGDGGNVGGTCVLSHTDPDGTGIPSGTLTFTVATSLRTSLAASELSVQLDNADTTQTAPTLVLTLDGPLPATYTLSSSGVMTAADAITGTFQAAAGTVSTAVARATTTADCSIKGGLCTACFSFTPTLGQVAGDILRIHGLSPTISPDLMMAGTMSSPFANGGHFKALLGLAEITLTDAIGAFETAEFCLTVNSPRADGNTLAVMFSSKGSNPSFETAVTVPSTYLNPTTDPAVEWTTASVFETSRIKSSSNTEITYNTLTFVLKPTVDIAAGATFSIAFATALQDNLAADTLLLESSVATDIGEAGAGVTSIFSSATLSFHASALVLTSTATMPSDEPTVFSVKVPNPSPTVPSTGIAVSIYTTAVGETTAGNTAKVPAVTTMTTPQYSTGGVLRADQSTAGWITSSMIQTSLKTMDDNAITFQLQPNTQLDAGDVLTFTGLTGLPGPESSASPLEVTGNTELLGGANTGVWDPDTGVLKLALTRSLPINEVSTFQVTFVNPTTTPTTAYTIQVTAGSIPTTTLTADPTSIGSGAVILSTTQGLWAVATVEQPSVADCNLCPMNFYFQPTSAVAQGASITITGLDGSATTANTALVVDDTTLAETADAGMFGGSCAWTNTDNVGSLVCTVALAAGLGTTNIMGIKVSTIEMPFIPKSVAPDVYIASTNNEAKIMQGRVFLPALPPVKIGQTPPINSLIEKSTGTVTLSFERQVQLSGTGSIQFHTCSDGAVAGDAITCSASAGTIEIANDDHVLLVTPGDDILSADGTCYFMTMTDGCLLAATDLGSSRYAGFPTDDNTVRFYTSGGPAVQLESFSPSAAEPVSFGTHVFEFTFSEEVARGSRGTIQLFDAQTNLPVEKATIDITETVNANGVILTFESTTVRYEIDPALLQIPLKQYYINIAAGAIRSETSGQLYAGLLDESSYLITIRAPANTPELASSTPGIFDTSVQAGTFTYSLTFGSAIQLSSMGSVGVYRQQRADEATVPIAEDIMKCDTGVLSNSNTTVTFTSAVPLYPSISTPTKEGTRGFYARVGSNCIYNQDLTVSNPTKVYWPGFSSTTDWPFFITSADARGTPTIKTSWPKNGATKVKSTSGWVRLSFKHRVTLGRGDVTLYRQSPNDNEEDSPVFTTSIQSKSIWAGNAVVSQDQNGKRVNFYIGTSTLSASNNYYLAITEGAIKSESAGLNFPGLDGDLDLEGNSRELKFATAAITKAGRKSPAPTSGGSLCLPKKNGKENGCLSIPSGFDRSTTTNRRAASTRATDRPIVISQTQSVPVLTAAQGGTLNTLSSEETLEPHDTTFSSPVTVCLVQKCLASITSLDSDSELTVVKKTTVTYGTKQIEQWVPVAGGEEITKSDGTCQMCYSTSTFSNWASGLFTAYPVVTDPTSEGDGTVNPGGDVNTGTGAGGTIVYFDSAASSTFSVGLIALTVCAIIALVL